MRLRRQNLPVSASVCLLPSARCVVVFAQRLLSRSSTVLAPDPTPYPSIWNHVFGVIWIRSLAGLPTEPVWRSGNGVGLGECAGTSDLRFSVRSPDVLTCFFPFHYSPAPKTASRATVNNCRSGLSSTAASSVRADNSFDAHAQNGDPWQRGKFSSRQEGHEPRTHAVAEHWPICAHHAHVRPRSCCRWQPHSR